MLNSYKQEMVRRAVEMMEAKDYSGLEAMAEILLQSANLKHVSASEAKDLLVKYEENFDINQLGAAIDILVDVYAA